MKGDYYKWKEGKKIWKMPWVIKYYKNVTDENQYNFAHKVATRAIIITALMLLFYGIGVGYFISMLI